MTTKEKIESVVNSFTTTLKPTFYVGSVQRLNLTQITAFPAVLMIQPISGKFIIDSQIKKRPNMLIWIALQNKSTLHRSGSDVNTDEEAIDSYAIEFIKQYNKSGHFDKLTEVDWSFAVDNTDHNLTFVALQFACREIIGTKNC